MILLQHGEDFYCGCKGEVRKREASRLNMAGSLNQTVRGERVGGRGWRAKEEPRSSPGQETKRAAQIK